MISVGAGAGITVVLSVTSSRSKEMEGGGGTGRWPKALIIGGLFSSCLHIFRNTDGYAQKQKLFVELVICIYLFPTLMGNVNSITYQSEVYLTRSVGDSSQWQYHRLYSFLGVNVYCVFVTCHMSGSGPKYIFLSVRTERPTSGCRVVSGEWARFSIMNRSSCFAISVRLGAEYRRKEGSETRNSQEDVRNGREQGSLAEIEGFGGGAFCIV